MRWTKKISKNYELEKDYYNKRVALVRIAKRKNKNKAKETDESKNS